MEFVEQLETLPDARRKAIVDRILSPNYDIKLAAGKGGKIDLDDLNGFANSVALDFNRVFKKYKSLEPDTDVDVQVQVMDRVVEFVEQLETLPDARRKAIVRWEERREGEESRARG